MIKFPFSGYINRLLFVLVIISFTLIPVSLYSQTLPVGNLVDKQFRLLQLYSDSVSNTSYLNRPVWNEQYQQLLKDPSILSDSWWTKSFISYHHQLPFNFQAGFISPQLNQTYNSTLPFGSNNGAAWYGKGITGELRGGVFLTSDYLTITLYPHFVWTQNSSFREPRFIPRRSNGEPTYQGIISGIDYPFRFGPSSISTADWGDSSIRLHYKNIEMGFSSEKLWWGPGVQNALIMSNNAPGLKQVFFGTRYPIKLPLKMGHLEFRLTGAFPEDSDYYPSSSPHRYTSGTLLIYSPGFIDGLHIGATRLSHMYIPEDGLTIPQLFSSQPFAERQRAMNNSDENEMASVFFRWVLKKSSAEFYGEYFREDSFYDLRDLYIQPDHDRAYTIGFQKIIKAVKYFDFIKVNAEINNLVPNRIDEVRPQTWYYRHSRVRQGHTNRGQILGASIGPGSGSQFIGLESYFSKGMIGVFFQRVEDNDYHFFNYYDRPSLGTGYKDLWRNQIDLNFGLNGLYTFESWLIGGGITFNHNLNYGRYGFGELDVDFETFNPDDLLNIQLQFSLKYLY